MSVEKLSLCMIVRDEERHLDGCLESFGPFVDQIVVVDSGSMDRTAEIAHRHGASVHHVPWRDDFSLARNESLRHATGQWVVWMDADDILPDGAGASLRALTGHEPAYAFTFTIENLGQAGRIESRFPQIRMFPNRIGVSFERPVHETLVPSIEQRGLPILATGICIHHSGYADSDTVCRKYDRNLSILQRWLENNPTDLPGRYHLANQLYQRSRIDEAIDEFRRVLASPGCPARDPYHFVLSSVYLGRALVRKGDAEAARGVLEEAHRANPSYSFLNRTLGECYLRLGQPEKAENCFSAAILPPQQSEILPQYERAVFEAYVFLGLIAEERGELHRATVHYGEAIVRNPGATEVHARLASCLRRSRVNAEEETISQD